MTQGSSPIGSGSASGTSSSRPSTTSAANNASPSTSANHTDLLSGGNPSNHPNEDLFALSEPLSFSQPAASNLADSSVFLGSGGNPFEEVLATAPPLMVGNGGRTSGAVAATGAWGSPVFAGERFWSIFIKRSCVDLIGVLMVVFVIDS